MNIFDIKSLTDQQKYTRKRILEISHQGNLSHIGSCLSVVDLIDAVYQVKKKNEKFILSNGHAGIALYVILEKNGLISANDIQKLYVHPDRNPRLNIDASSGSLGQGLPIALGMAIASPQKKVYCTISDGECAEGSIWETIRIANEKKVRNLKIIVNFNGWAGYDSTSKNLLKEKFIGFGYVVQEINGHNIENVKSLLKLQTRKSAVIFGVTTSNQFYFLKDQDAHYYTMKETDYGKALLLLK